MYGRTKLGVRWEALVTNPNSVLRGDVRWIWLRVLPSMAEYRIDTHPAMKLSRRVDEPGPDSPRGAIEGKWEEVSDPILRDFAAQVLVEVEARMAPKGSRS